MSHDVKTAEARCAELAKLEQKTAARSAVAASKLADAETDERNHTDRLLRAEEAYAAEPTDSNATAISKAQEALNLARLRVRAPRAEHEAAQAALTAWRADVDAAAAEVRRATLEHRASLEEYNQRTAKAFQKLLVALEAVQDASREIDQAFEAANAAARELGEPELASFHQIKPFLEREAARHGAAGLVNAYGYVKAAFPFQHGLAQALACPAVESLTTHARNFGAMTESEAGPLLERIFACRTVAEAEALVKQHEAGVESARRAAATEAGALSAVRAGGAKIGWPETRGVTYSS